MGLLDMNAYNSAEAKQGGGSGFEQMEPGIYELYIQAVRTEWDTKQGHTDGIAKQCVRLVWDVAQGQFEKKYTEAYFVDWNGQPDPEKDYMHSCFLSWKNMEYFKGKAEAINANNPGFDLAAAVDAERWDMLIGKKFWAVIDGTVTLNNKGYDKWVLDIGAWITPTQVKTGEHPEPKITDNRMKSGGKASTATVADPYGDIPL